MFEHRTDRNVALRDLRSLFSLLKIELTPGLEAKFITKFDLKYNQVKNKVVVRESYKKTQQAKIFFIDWIKDLLDQVIGFSHDFKNEEVIGERVGSLGYAFGLLLGIIEYGVSSPMMVEWEYLGDSILLAEEIERKIDAMMVELQRVNKKVVLQNISQRASSLSARHKAKRADFGLAYHTLLNIAGALVTKDLG